MNTAIKTIEINETLRLSIYQDEWSYTPEDILGEASKWTKQGWFILPKHGWHGLEWWITERYSAGEFTEDLTRIYQVAYEYSRFGSPKCFDEVETALLKHLERNGQIADLVELRGYSQGEYAKAVVYSEGFSVNGMAESLKAWFAGDIYAMALETDKVFTAADGEEITRTETLESIGCMVFDPWVKDEELLDIAKDYFGELASHV